MLYPLSYEGGWWVAILTGRTGLFAPNGQL